MTITVQAIDRCLERLAGLARQDPALAEELVASAGEFFGGTPPSGSAAEVLGATRRHLEWFLLERHSPALFGVPIERWLERLRALPDAEPDGAEQALLDSFTGLFEATDVRAGEGAWLRDVAGFGSFALVEPEGAGELAPGDVIVGRLFPVGAGLHCLSQGAGWFRSPPVLEAVERDLARWRAERGRNVLRFSQRELERMFWSGGGRPVAEDPRGAARAVLAAGGVDPARAESILAELGSSRLPSDNLTPGAGDRLGEILTELAFDTEVDLEAARRVLTLVWAGDPAPPRTSTSPSADSAPAASGSERRRAAVEAFARGRASGGDLESLLADLERDLGLDGLEGGDEEEEADDEPIPDFPGVVGALVTEFLWETGVEHGAARAERFGVLRHLGEYGARIGLAEGLTGLELVRFTTFWIPERRALASAAEAEALLDALESFAAWAEAAHDLPLARDFGPTLARLRESFARVVALNARLAQRPLAGDDEIGELVEVLETAGGGPARARDQRGTEHALAPEDSARLRELQPGDRLRAVAGDTGLSVRSVYPPESAILLDSSR